MRFTYETAEHDVKSIQLDATELNKHKFYDARCEHEQIESLLNAINSKFNQLGIESPILNQNYAYQAMVDNKMVVKPQAVYGGITEKHQKYLNQVYNDYQHLSINKIIDEFLVFQPNFEQNLSAQELTFSFVMMEACAKQGKQMIDFNKSEKIYWNHLFKDFKEETDGKYIKNGEYDFSYLIDEAKNFIPNSLKNKHKLTI